MNSHLLKFIRFIKSILCLIFFGTCKVLLNRNKHFYNNILIINTDQIGDIVITFHFIVSILLSKKYDNVYYLLDDRYIELLSKTDVKIIPWDKTKYRKNLMYRVKFLKELNTNYSFNTCINLTDQRGNSTEELVMASNSNENFTLNKNSFYISNFILKILNKHYRFISSGNSLYQKHLELLNMMGIDYIKKYLHNFADSILDEYILVAPFASVSFKSWDKNKYKILINKLSQRWKVVLVGSSDQFDSLEDLRCNDNIVNNAGKFSLYELQALINNCKLFIGNDSGLTHLALHYNKRVVAITGLASKDIYFKEMAQVKYLFEDFNCSNCRWFCYKRDYACVKLVKVEKVYNSCNELLNAIF